MKTGEGVRSDLVSQIISLMHGIVGGSVDKIGREKKGGVQRKTEEFRLDSSLPMGL